MCVFQALSFPFQRWLSWREPRLQCTLSNTPDPCRNKPLLFISLPTLLPIPSPTTNPCIFHKTRTSGPISLFGIFYVMHFFFLRLWKTGTYPKAAKQAITKSIWVRMQSEEEKKRNEEEYKQITVTLSNYFSNDN